MTEPIELTPAERTQLLRVLTHVLNLVAARLLAQGVSRRLLVRVLDEAVQETFGEGARAVDARALLGEDAG